MMGDANDRAHNERIINAARGASGGWSKEQLAAWGIGWPPPPGWRHVLTRGDALPDEPPVPRPEPPKAKPKPVKAVEAFKPYSEYP